MKKIDVLVFSAHPDDAELGCGGTILKLKKQGYSVGMVDLTQGELGTRGTAKIRLEEANEAAKVLGLSFRSNLNFQDNFFQVDEEHRMAVAEKIRKYQPKIVLANSIHDRHPDHGKAAQLIYESIFTAGLSKIESEYKAWRPQALYHYVQDYYMKPDIVVDISDYFKGKMKAISCFQSQFYDPGNKEPATAISSKDFQDFLEGRAREAGRLIGTTFGEGFICRRPPAIDDLVSLK